MRSREPAKPQNSLEERAAVMKKAVDDKNAALKAAADAKKAALDQIKAAESNL